MNLAYRADIDGLRAFAVSSVLIFHAFPSLMPGGFVGVDVFFVISGYLISGILFREIESSTFSFADFYARRIKRIFPALLIMAERFQDSNTVSTACRDELSWRVS